MCHDKVIGRQWVNYDIIISVFPPACYKPGLGCSRRGWWWSPWAGRRSCCRSSPPPPTRSTRSQDGGSSSGGKSHISQWCKLSESRHQAQVHHDSNVFHHDYNTCERSRDLSETRGLSQDGTIVDKEFLPRFRYVNRLRMEVKMMMVVVVVMTMMKVLMMITMMMMMTMMIITLDAGRPPDESRSLYCVTSPVFSGRPDLSVVLISNMI